MILGGHTEPDHDQDPSLLKNPDLIKIPKSESGTLWKKFIFKVISILGGHTKPDLDPELSLLNKSGSDQNTRIRNSKKKVHFLVILMVILNRIWIRIQAFSIIRIWPKYPNPEPYCGHIKPDDPDLTKIPGSATLIITLYSPGFRHWDATPYTTSPVRLQNPAYRTHRQR